jgi:hypothetical protein
VSNSLETRGFPLVPREPARLDLSLRAALDAAYAEASFGAVSEARLPSALRLGLERRREDLGAALKGASEARILAALATLQRMVARAEGDAEEAEFAMRCDLADLAGVPAWALEAAAAAFRRGEAGAGKFRPTAGELRREAMRRVEGYAEELARIDRVLRARIEPARKPLDPDRRRELAEAMRAAAGAAAP